MKQELNRRYALFGGENHECHGGARDLISTYDNEDTAFSQAKLMMGMKLIREFEYSDIPNEYSSQDIQWWHIIDLETSEMIGASSDWQYQSRIIDVVNKGEGRNYGE